MPKKFIGIQKLKKGDFNYMGQTWQEGGTLIITLNKRNEGKSYRFAVTDLYGPNEKVLWEEVIGK